MSRSTNERCSFIRFAPPPLSNTRCQVCFFHGHLFDIIFCHQPFQSFTSSTATLYLFLDNGMEVHGYKLNTILLSLCNIKL